MTFAVVDIEGTLTIRPDRATREAVNAVMPGGWWDMVRLHLRPDLFGFVDDSGHVTGLPRNPVGAVMLAYLGANAIGNPYAGPVVITGWQEPSDGSEIRDLTGAQVEFLRERHAQLSDVLAGGELWFSPDHREGIRQYAEFVRTAPSPETVIITDPAEVLNYLRGGA